jgi:glycosyltransferase involved in cell wall biosynthesis
MHAGNIGLVMGLEVIIESANITAENKNIHYVFLGEGLKKPDLMKMVDKYNLSNVEFIPIRPRSEMPLFLTAADAHFVAMGRGMNYSLPSKLSGIMSAGRPVIGISDNQTDMFKIIKEANCGVCVQPGDAEKLGQEINRMASNLTVCETYGKNGRVYAEKFFSRKELIQKYYSILVNL